MTVYIPSDPNVRWKGRETWSEEDREFALANPDMHPAKLGGLLGRTEAAINTFRYNLAATGEREILLTQSATRTNSRWTPRDWEVCRDEKIGDLDAAALLSRTPMAIRTRRSEIRNGKFPLDDYDEGLEPAAPKPSIPGLLRQLADAFEARGL